MDGVGVGADSAWDSGLVYSSLLLLGRTTADTTATAILLMATATAILLIAMGTAILVMAMDIVALTMAAIIRVIGMLVIPTVGPTMDMPAIRIVDRLSNLLHDIKKRDRLRAVFSFRMHSGSFSLRGAL